MITARFETKKGIFKITEFTLILERQRPAYSEFATEELISKDDHGIFMLGSFGKVTPMATQRIIESSQRNINSFDQIALDYSRWMLDAPFVKQLQRVNLEGALKAICGEFDLTLKVLTVWPTKPLSLVFFGTIRNALDQIWAAFECVDERWYLDLIGKTLYLLPGHFDNETIPIQPVVIKREVENGVVLENVPTLRPYLKILHRNQEQVIDKVVYRSKPPEMTLFFAA